MSPVIFADDEKNETTFVPTREWQTVKKGTPIPEGLHVRHNFQTGVTEAKLMDSDDVKEKDSETSNSSRANSVTLHPEKAIPDEQKPQVAIDKSKLDEYSVDELQSRLQKIIEDGTEKDINDEHGQPIKQKFRYYETLKKEFRALGLNITNDSELLSNYFQKFQPHRDGVAMGTSSLLEVEEVLDILYDLEYLLHHVDNAKVFTDMNGMTKIISPCLNGTNNEIKAEALKLLGAAVQSNPKVQSKALENDFVQKLLQILSTNGKIEVKSRCIFALSALIRQFPAAQKVWIDHGGVEIVGKVLLDEQLQIQMKVMKLINDLITERQNLQMVTDDYQLQIRIKAYAAANIEQKLLACDYCKHLSNLMTKCFRDELNTEYRTDNYEFIETISESMITLIPVCKDQFSKTKDTLLPIIQHLLNLYQNLDPIIQPDENEILKNLTLLIEKLRATVSEIPHDEL